MNRNPFEQTREIIEKMCSLSIDQSINLTKTQIGFDGDFKKFIEIAYVIEAWRRYRSNEINKDVLIDLLGMDESDFQVAIFLSNLERKLKKGNMK